MTETKARSELVDALLAQHGTPGGDARASEHVCQGAKFHSPTPLTTRPFSLAEDKVVWLCPTCLSKLQCFVHLHLKDPQSLTWDVMRQFGNAIRMFGQEIIASERLSHA